MREEAIMEKNADSADAPHMYERNLAMSAWVEPPLKEIGKMRLGIINKWIRENCGGWVSREAWQALHRGPMQFVHKLTFTLISPKDILSEEGAIRYFPANETSHTWAEFNEAVKNTKTLEGFEQEKLHDRNLRANASYYMRCPPGWAADIAKVIAPEGHWGVIPWTPRPIFVPPETFQHGDDCLDQLWAANERLRRYYLEVPDDEEGTKAAEDDFAAAQKVDEQEMEGEVQE